MQKEISKEVYDALKDVPGITVGMEVMYYIDTDQISMPLPPSPTQLDLIDAKPRIKRRSSNMQLRLTNGYSQRRLTSDILVKVRDVAAAILKAQSPLMSRDLATRIAPTLSSKNPKSDAGYYIKRLIELGVLEQDRD